MRLLTRFGWRGAAAAIVAAALAVAGAAVTGGGAIEKMGLQPGATALYHYPAPRNRAEASVAYGCTSADMPNCTPPGSVASITVLAPNGNLIVHRAPRPGDRLVVTYRGQ